MTDQVICRSDSHYAERPVAFFYEGTRLAIQQIQARWRTPENRHFRVLAEGSLLFELTYHENEDRWVIEPI
jgi:hypothetical protein